jgi:hypothetical protein
MAEPAPVQFSVKTILAITAGTALFFAAGAWFGAAGYAGFMVIAAVVIWLVNPQSNYLGLLGIGATLLFVIGLFFFVFALSLPALHSARIAGRRSQCTSNLKQLGLGLQNYADYYKCFPPVYTTDAEGKPMHSWRVLILPFIEERPLYDKYDLNEPWDGPHNRLLAKLTPAIFRCPEDAKNPAGVTNYVAVVGPETIWQPDHSTRFADITDGSSYTIAVIEASGAGINWMEPRDLPFSALDQGINPKQGEGVSSHHPGAVVAMFADGHTQTIQEDISLETLKALFTKAGGEKIGEAN